MASIESTILKNVNSLTTNNPTLRKELLNVGFSKPLSFHLF